MGLRLTAPLLPNHVLPLTTYGPRLCCRYSFLGLRLGFFYGGVGGSMDFHGMGF